MKPIPLDERRALAEAGPLPLMGLARLMTMAFRGEDLRPLASALIQRAEADEQDAEALMDLSTVLFLQGLRDLGLATQAQALKTRRLFRLRTARQPRMRLLAIMAPGDLMTNTPLAFLVEGSDVQLSMLYLLPGETLPAELPPHDVLFVAVSESDPTHGLLHQLASDVAGRSRALCNPPARILRTARDQAYAALLGAPGIAMPASARASRALLKSVADGSRPVDQLVVEGRFPLIVRPVDSHAGHGLERIPGPADLPAYLAAHPADEFFISNFIDYSSADGQFRKYRVALVEGVPFAAHMGVSSHWMVHYLNAGMTESAEKRAEEALFMSTFEIGFAHRHRAALAALADRFGLDWLVVDCAETPEGELLVFEVDPGAVVHSMDPPDLFPYKRFAMNKLYAAFHAMLARAAAATAG